MKKRTLTIPMLFLVACLCAADLDDLQRLARQLNQIRTEYQTVKDSSLKTQAAQRLQRQQVKRLKDALTQKCQLLTDENQTLVLKQQKINREMTVLEKNLLEQQQLLLNHVKVLKKRMKTMPPTLEQSVLEQLEAIERLTGQPEQLPQQLTMLKTVHQQIRQAAKSLTRAQLELPQLKAQFMVAFLGCTWAVAASPDGTRAAFGFPEKHGWNWQETTEHHDEIIRFFNILNQQAPAQLVNLPLKLVKP